MSSILSRSEVDSLLAALDRDVTASRSPGTDANHVARSGSRNSGRIGAESLRELQRVHERFAVEFGNELCDLFATAVEVKTGPLDQLTWGEHVSGINDPACLAVIAFEPSETEFLLEIEPALAFPIVDRLLGGQGGQSSMVPRRPLTEIELRLLSRVVDLAGAALARVWLSPGELRPRTTQLEVDPQDVRFASTDGAIVQARFDLTLGDMGGSFDLCCPSAAIERLSAALSKSQPRNQGVDRPKHSEPDSGAPRSQMIVRLASTWLTPDETVNLEVGDVIVTGCEQSQPLTVLVDGTPRFAGFAGLVKDRKAVRIGSAISMAGDGSESSSDLPATGDSPARD